MVNGGLILNIEHCGEVGENHADVDLPLLEQLAPLRILPSAPRYN